MEITQEQLLALNKAIENNRFSLGESIDAAKSSENSSKIKELTSDIINILDLLESKKNELDTITNFKPSEESLNNQSKIRSNTQLNNLRNGKKTPELEYEIARMLFIDDSSSEEEVRTAKKLVLSAANSGFFKAQNMVATFYESGLYFEKNINDAINWFKKAVKNGCNDSKVSLGLMYEYGNEYLTADLNKAFELYKDAANSNHAYGQYNLATLYEYGDGDIEKDIDKAIELYTKSADNNDANAQNALGAMYYSGDGIEENHKKAFELFHKAASNGLSFAQSNVAEMYRDGEGVKKNKQKAIKYFRLAANQGYKPAKESLIKLSS